MGKNTHEQQVHNHSITVSEKCSTCSYAKGNWFKGSNT